MAKKRPTKSKSSRTNGNKLAKDLAGPKSSRNRVVHRSPKTDTISHSEAREAIYRYIKKS